MSETSILDIISPIMIGPSSSHTAGAVRMGLLARNIYGCPIEKVKIILYNSYAKTGIGHGSDKGLIAGLLGFNVDNILIKDIFNTFEASKIEYIFEYKENFTRHPNAVDFIFEGEIIMEISARSIGGGEIIVDKINNFPTMLDGKFNTILIVLDDKTGSISKITDIIQKENINIANLSCERKAKGSTASCSISLDGDIQDKIMDKIKCEVEKNISPKLYRYIKKLDI